MQLELSLTESPCSHIPFYYNGSKRRAAKHIIKHFPPITEIVSPFIGGAGLEIVLTQKQIYVYGYDKLPHLINTWYHIFNYSKDMVTYVQRHLEHLDTDDCNQLASHFNQGIIKCDFEGACIYWFLTWRCFRNNPYMKSYRKTKREIPYWRILNYHNNFLKIEQADFEESLNKHPNMFAYLDPPYPDVNQLYGPKGDTEFHLSFDHERLAKVLYKRTTPWLLSYNDKPIIHELYPKDRFTWLPQTWFFSGNKGKIIQGEVMITNYVS